MLSSFKANGWAGRSIHVENVLRHTSVKLLLSLTARMHHIDGFLEGSRSESEVFCHGVHFAVTLDDMEQACQVYGGHA